MPWLAAGTAAMMIRNAFQYGKEVAQSRKMNEKIHSLKKNNMAARTKYIATMLKKKGRERKALKVKTVIKKRRVNKGYEPGTAIIPYGIGRYRLGGSSRSSGFLKTKVPRKKFSKRKISRAYNRGTTMILEHNATASSTEQTLYIGHNTHTATNIRYEMFLAILKVLFDKMGQNIIDRNQLLSSFNISVGDTFNVDYRTTVNGAPTTRTVTVAAGNTINTLIADFGAAARAYFTNGYQSSLLSISFVPTAGSAYGPVILELQNMKIKVYGKSTLKLQNRTINSAGADESVDVDNMPLYGKGYWFKGNTAEEAQASSEASDPYILCSNGANGIIGSWSASGTDSLPQEPPPAVYFRNVKYTGKVKIDPGEVKTSVLTSTFFGYINQLLHLLSVPDGEQRCKLGVTRLFAVEKMINSDATRPIIVSYEHNFVLGTTCYPARKLPMKPFFGTV